MFITRMLTPNQSFIIKLLIITPKIPGNNSYPKSIPKKNVVIAKHTHTNETFIQYVSVQIQNQRMKHLTVCSVQIQY